MTVVTHPEKTLIEWADVERRAPSVNSFGPNRPLYIAHRGGGFNAPENTAEAFREAVLAGVYAIEPDVQLLSDGATCVMHDTTVDRMTTSTGNVVALNTTGWLGLNIDAGTQMGGGWSDVVKPALFENVLTEFKGKAIIVPEAKASGTPTAVIAALQKIGIAKDQALVQGGTTTAPSLAVNAGYQGLYLTSTAADISTVAGLGIQWVGLDAGLASDSVFLQWISSGRKTLAWTINRRYRRDQLLALGVSGFFSDDPVYLEGKTAARTTDPFALQRWYPGIQGDGYAFDNTVRGRFTAPNYWGWAETDANARFVLQGWGCPILNKERPENFSITLSIKFGATADATRWASLFLADSSYGDRFFKNNGADGANGYHFLFRKTGNIEIYAKNNGAESTLGTAPSTAIADGEEVTYRVSVTSTAVTIARLDGAGNVVASKSVNDTTYRGGYFHLGHAQVGALFRNITIAPL